MDLWHLALLIILLITLMSVVSPLISAHGSQALGKGLETDDLSELSNRKRLLIRQIREGELTSGGNENGAIESLKSELAALLVKMDALKGSEPSIQSQNAAEASDVNESSQRALLPPITLLATITFGSLALYAGMGHPFLDQGALQQEKTSGSPASMPNIGDMVERLAARLQDEPDNLKGWMQLARSYEVMGNSAKAMEAYGHVLSREAGNLDAAVFLADLEVSANNDPALFKQGLERFRWVLEQDPKRPEALWFMGAVAYRVGDGGSAVDYWSKLLLLIPEDQSDSRANVEHSIEKARQLPPYNPTTNSGGVSSE
ncbi:MAG: hypothetical protein HQL50_11210 [Magnetococcales bacterium]|nr:hypothetical protein [Magnetococcales bacterium]